MEGLEINIPLEAEVKSIPLQSLPSSVRRKMLDDGASRSIPDSTHCIWICPVFCQRKGHNDTPQAQGKVREHMLKALGDRARLQGPTTQWQMSFVTPNCKAYRVLKETMPGVFHKVSSAQVPPGTPSDTQQDAVIVHCGRIYLSVKKCRKKLAPEPQLVAQPSPALTALTKKNKKGGPLNSKGLKRKQDSCKGAHDDTPQALNSSPALLSYSQDQEPTEDSTEQRDLSRAEESPSLALYLPTEPAALQQDYDFEELAYKERIAQMKAKLQQSEAALYNRQPTSK